MALLVDSFKLPVLSLKGKALDYAAAYAIGGEWLPPTKRRVHGSWSWFHAREIVWLRYTRDVVPLHADPVYVERLMTYALRHWVVRKDATPGVVLEFQGDGHTVQVRGDSVGEVVCRALVYLKYGTHVMVPTCFLPSTVEEATR